MRLVTIDFETYWDQDYTLSKMTTESYVRDERFTVLMVGVKVAGKPSVVLSHEDFRRALPLLRLEDSAVLCHHAHFDGFILSQHYGVRPRLFFDTLSMARSVYPNAKSNSLKALAERLGIGEKGHEVENTKGKRTLTPDEFRRLAAYCRNDVDLTYEIFQRLKPELPVSEYQLIDLTVKLFTDPILRLNKDLLREEQAAEIKRKDELLAACVSDRDTLSSNPKFAALLESLGVVPPMKLSPAGLKRGEEVLTYAFGKSDEGFKALLSHDDETVRAVCEARLGVKSTINETRAARLLDVASRGPVPIYLTYWGAHTGRFSGGDKCLVESTEVVCYTRSMKVVRKRITEVLPDDLVWDGEEFVSHDGVIYQGLMEVIEYDGIEGTPDHRVYLSDGGCATLQEARARGAELKSGLPIGGLEAIEKYIQGDTEALFFP